jgi:hypothetical protein
MSIHHDSHKDADRPKTAIISILFSGLGGLTLGLILGFYRSTIFYHLMCFFSGSLHISENSTTMIILAPIYLSLSLALIFAFVGNRSSGTSYVIVASRVLALGLFLLAGVVLPFLLFLSTACYG